MGVGHEIVGDHSREITVDGKRLTTSQHYWTEWVFPAKVNTCLVLEQKFTVSKSLSQNISDINHSIT